MKKLLSLLTLFALLLAFGAMAEDGGSGGSDGGNIHDAHLTQAITLAKQSYGRAVDNDRFRVSLTEKVKTIIDTVNNDGESFANLLNGLSAESNVKFSTDLKKFDRSHSKEGPRIALYEHDNRMILINYEVVSHWLHPEEKTIEILARHILHEVGHKLGFPEKNYDQALWSLADTIFEFGQEVKLTPTDYYDIVYSEVINSFAEIPGQETRSASLETYIQSPYLFTFLKKQNYTEKDVLIEYNPETKEASYGLRRLATQVATCMINTECYMAWKAWDGLLLDKGADNGPYSHFKATCRILKRTGYANDGLFFLRFLNVQLNDSFNWEKECPSQFNQ